MRLHDVVNVTHFGGSLLIERELVSAIADHSADRGPVARIDAAPPPAWLTPEDVAAFIPSWPTQVHVVDDLPPNEIRLVHEDGSESRLFGFSWPQVWLADGAGPADTLIRLSDPRGRLVPEQRVEAWWPNPDDDSTAWFEPMRLFQRLDGDRWHVERGHPPRRPIPARAIVTMLGQTDVRPD